jgi:hypothetical protein
MAVTFNLERSFMWCKDMFSQFKTYMNFYRLKWANAEIAYTENKAILSRQGSQKMKRWSVSVGTGIVIRVRASAEPERK